MLEPLSFKDQSSEEEEKELCGNQCFLCGDVFPMATQCERNIFLAHVLRSHKLVIGDAPTIPLFEKYVDYWRERWKGRDLKDFCAVINTNSAPNDIGEKEQYYLLSNNLPEEKRLRDSLQRTKLELMLAEQQKERNNTSFDKPCLFCKKEFAGNRSVLFDHMKKDHFFNVGNVENIVFVEEFLDILKDKLERLICLYCEKVFKDWNTLREHMRKKQHKRINSQNKEYDRFYVINYLEPGKTWEQLQAEEDTDERSILPQNRKSTERDWEDWDESIGSQAVCLFCDEFHSDAKDTVTHMKDLHNFDLNKLRNSPDFGFYEQVKIVNYMRHKVYQKVCPHCSEKLDTTDELRCHMTKESHFKLPQERMMWDKPDYFFSTYDNDALLCFDNEE